MHGEIAAIVRSPELSSRIAAEGAEPIGGTPEAFGDFIATEAKRWAVVLKEAGIRME